MVLELDPVEGYDWKNYDKKKGINPNGEDIPSNAVVEQVCELILDGYADDTIRTILYRTYGMNSYCVRFITNKAHSVLTHRTEKQTEKMLEKQNSRLFRLYRDAMDDGDTATALKVLAEINKLNKLYVTKVELSTDVYRLDLLGE